MIAKECDLAGSISTTPVSCITWMGPPARIFSFLVLVSMGASVHSCRVPSPEPVSPVPVPIIESRTDDDRWAPGKLAEIQLGMTEQDIIRRFGPPNLRSTVTYGADLGTPWEGICLAYDAKNVEFKALRVHDRAVFVFDPGITPPRLNHCELSWIPTPSGANGTSGKIMPGSAFEAHLPVGTRGRRRPPSDNLIYTWRKLVSEQPSGPGSDLALLLLGSALRRNGEPMEARQFLERAASEGNDAAAYEIGVMLAEGEGTPPDVDAALPWLRRASKPSFPQAMHYLGILYQSPGHDPAVQEEGAELVRQSLELVKSDRLRAYIKPFPPETSDDIAWYLACGTLGDMRAQLALGQLFEEGIWAVRDCSAALDWYRRAADQGDSTAQFRLGWMLSGHDCVPIDGPAAVSWYRRASEQGNHTAEYNLGVIYAEGQGVPKDMVEAVKWFRQAGEHGEADAQFNLGLIYASGDGIPRNWAEAIKWYRIAANQGHVSSQLNLGTMFAKGEGVPVNDVEAYRWWSRASAQGNQIARENLQKIERQMSREEIAQAQHLAQTLPGAGTGDDSRMPSDKGTTLLASGSGFFVSEMGDLVTNAHVVSGARRVEIRCRGITQEASVVMVDAANDLALLRCQGPRAALPIKGSGGIGLGLAVVTIGFPNPEFQGNSAKYSEGVIAGLTGPEGDPRYFQVSLPIQPGNSGGPLVNSEGFVVGVVSGKLNQFATLAATGQLPENVNYAVKGSILVAFLDGEPEMANRIKHDSPGIEGQALAGYVESACAQVLVYQ